MCCLSNPLQCQSTVLLQDGNLTALTCANCWLHSCAVRLLISHDVCREHQVYYFSKFQVKPANKQYATVKNDYELHFDNR